MADGGRLRLIYTGRRRKKDKWCRHKKGRVTGGKILGEPLILAGAKREKAFPRPASSSKRKRGRRFLRLGGRKRKGGKGQH